MNRVLNRVENPLNLRHKAPPTHRLVIDIPINTKALEDLDYDAIQQTLKLVLVVSQAALDRVICDDAQVTFAAVEPVHA